MKTNRRQVGWAAVAGLAVVLLGLVGCEGSSNEDTAGVDAYFDRNPYASDPRDTPETPELEVTPAIFSVSFLSQEAVFTAAGGEGRYRWYLSNPANGEISDHGANQAVYIVRVLGVNTITVQDEAGHYGVAYIYTADSVKDMAIAPSSVALSGGLRQASFTVTGGRPPYTWSAGNVSLGTVSYAASSSHLAAYTAVSGAYGLNVITVRDAEGRLASATVTQTQ